MDLEQFAKALESIDIHALNKRIVGDECNFLESDINHFTPVDTGNLKDNNNVIPDDGSILITNKAEYAQEVEYGHKTANGGFIAGQFFVKKGIEKWEKGFSERYIKALNDELKTKGIG